MTITRRQKFKFFTTAHLGALLVLVASTPSRATAETSEKCRFVPRERVEFYLSALSPSVKGFVSCFDAHPELGVFYMLRLAKALSRTEIESVVRAHAENIVPDANGFAAPSTTVFNQQLGAGQRQLLFRSTRTFGHEATAHYAFEVADGKNGGIFLFIHSIGERDFLRHRRTIEQVKREIASADFLTTIPSR